MWLAAVAFAAPLCAEAQAMSNRGLGDWSVAGAEINTGRPFEDVRVGWPDVDFGYTFNVSPKMDMGIRFGLLYGYEGTTDTTGFGVGLALYAPLRFQIARSSDVNVLVHVDPGLKLYTGASYQGACVDAFGDVVPCNISGPTQFGFMFPVGIVVGGSPVRELPNLEVGGGFDLNLALFVTSPVNFIIGPMVGPYVEYHVVNPNVAVGLTTRFGAAIPTASGASSAFAFQMLAYAGYRLF
jgi:hypothetical protein